MNPSENSGSHSMSGRIWFSEDSSIGRRLKQFVAFVVPRPLLVAAKKRYYLALFGEFEDAPRSGYGGVESDRPAR